MQRITLILVLSTLAFIGIMPTSQAAGIGIVVAVLMTLGAVALTGYRRARDSRSRT